MMASSALGARACMTSAVVFLRPHEKDSISNFTVWEHNLARFGEMIRSCESRHSITEEQLVTHVEYLIDNIYVNIGNKVFRQCVGIPMGTDCAPLLANLFIFFYEYNYMKDLIKTKLVLAKKFNNTMRYIDDLLTLNNATFHSAITDIYPHELQLKKTTECETTVLLRCTNNYRKWEVFNSSV